MGLLYVFVQVALLASIINGKKNAKQELIKDQCWLIEEQRHCLNLYYTPNSTWNKAKKSCKRPAQFQAIFNTNELIGAMDGFMAGLNTFNYSYPGTTDVWIGGRRNCYKKKLVSVNPEIDITISRLSGNQTKNEHICAFITQEGNVSQGSCNTNDTYHALCATNLDMSYDVSNETMDWYEANTYCASQNHSAFLATNRSQVPTNRSVWLGLSNCYWSWAPPSNNKSFADVKKLSPSNIAQFICMRKSSENPWNTCLYFETTGGRYAEKKCDSNSSYYICHNVTEMMPADDNSTTTVSLPGDQKESSNETSGRSFKSPINAMMSADDESSNETSGGCIESPENPPFITNVYFISGGGTVVLLLLLIIAGLVAYIVYIKKQQQNRHTDHHHQLPEDPTSTPNTAEASASNIPLDENLDHVYIQVDTDRVSAEDSDDEICVDNDLYATSGHATEQCDGNSVCVDNAIYSCSSKPADDNDDICVDNALYGECCEAAMNPEGEAGQLCILNVMYERKGETVKL